MDRWGANVGVTAALLAREGFTGAPALTVEHADAAQFWNDLGTRWRIREQYFKVYPVCRWAQPAIEAALGLQRAHSFAAEDVATIAIESFREAVALGSQCAAPRTTEEAQYSLLYPVAAALVFGAFGPQELETDALADPRVRRLQGVITLTEDATFSRRFPAPQRTSRSHSTSKHSPPKCVPQSLSSPMPDSRAHSKAWEPAS